MSCMHLHSVSDYAIDFWMDTVYSSLNKAAQFDAIY